MSGVLGVLVGYAGAAVVALAALAAAYLRGRSSANAKREAQDGRDYIETRRRMDAVENDLGDDDGAIRDLLRARGQRKGDL